MLERRKLKQKKKKKRKIFEGKLIARKTLFPSHPRESSSTFYSPLLPSERASERIKRDTPFSLPPVWREKKNLFLGEKMISFLARSRQTFFSIPFHLTVYSIVRYRRLLSLLRSVVKRLFRGRVILGRDGERERSRKITQNVGEERGIRWRVYSTFYRFLVFLFLSPSIPAKNKIQWRGYRGEEGRGTFSKFWYSYYIYIYTHIDTQRPEICIRLQQSNPFLRWKSEILVRRSTRRCTFGKRHRSRENFTCE